VKRLQEERDEVQGSLKRGARDLEEVRGRLEEVGQVAGEGQGVGGAEGGEGQEEGGRGGGTGGGL
jgi:hypothetical protein